MDKRVGPAKIVIALVLFIILGTFQQSHRALAFRGSDEPVPIRDWTSENVEGTKDVGRYPSLAVDPEGTPHIGYYDYTNIDIRYTYWNGDSWTRETVDHLNTDYISLMLDGTTPHMLFGNWRLVYAYRNSLGWQTETIEVGSTNAFRSGSLALDMAGNPHIAYYDYDNGLYKYAHRTSSGWVIEPLRERDYAIATTSITIDQSGNPHIAFVDSFDLIYAGYTETGWDFEVVETGYPSNVAIQMDNDDHPQISYLSGNIVDELRYASKSTGIWMIETVDSVAVDITSSTSLALSANSVPYISYYDDDLEMLKVANRASGSWNSELVENAAGIGEVSSLVFDNSDNLHIAYYDASLEAVKYGLSTPSGWDIQIVHITYGAGDSFSMVLDSGDYPHLAYSAGWFKNKALRYARKTAQGWVYESVYHTEYFRHASLVLDSNESPHISLFDDQTAEFIYAWRSDTGWITETVDTDGHYTGLNALAVNSQDEPHLAYFVEKSLTEGSLRYAERTASGWITKTLQSYQSKIPGGISMHMDHADHPHLAYGLAGLWYGWDNGSDWTFEQVEQYSSGKIPLTLDSSDHAHISYRRDSNMIYAHNKSGTWSTETVDDSPDTGFNSSLVLDSDEVPHISYYDRGNLTYMYASQTADGWFLESVLKVPISVSVIQPDTDLNLDSEGKPWIATSTLNFLTDIMQIILGGELYVPHWVYLPALYR